MQPDGGSLLSFGPNFQSCSLDKCLIINHFKQFYRMKDILHVSIVSKKMASSTFISEQIKKHQWPVNTTDDLVGIHYVPDDSVQSYKLSGQFINIFLVPEIREPNIGKFLNRNPEILKKALNCDDFLYEKPFKWLEGNSNLSEDHIQPDFVLKSSKSQFYDICDIKKPLLDQANITRGEHSRRRFKDEVNEGISQLANYEEYFRYPKNAAFAKEKYNVEIDAPKLILVIGNFENTDIQEIQEASRHLKDNYIIMDYDSLNAAYLARFKKNMGENKF
jgi:hypothetical protein